MEVSGVKTLWKHMNEIWALFCLNVPSIKCSVDVKRTGFQQWLLVFPQKSAPLRPPRSPLRRMVFSSQRVHSYSGPDWEKNSSSGAALFKHNSFFSPLRSYNWIIFSSVKNKTSENFRFSISLINGWMRRQNDSKFELAVLRRSDPERWKQEFSHHKFILHVNELGRAQYQTSPPTHPCRYPVCK